MGENTSIIRLIRWGKFKNEGEIFVKQFYDFFKTFKDYKNVPVLGFMIFQLFGRQTKL